MQMVMAQILAAAAGTTLPLFGLALIVRWQMLRAAKSASTRLAMRPRAKPRAKGLSLAWLKDTLSPSPPSGGGTEPPGWLTTGRCTDCGYQNTPGVTFCRRCGSRIA